MKKENALFIANILENEIKKETELYNKIHNEWVNDLIKATKEFFNENNFQHWHLNYLINNYKETKEWYESKDKKEVE